MHKFVRVLDNPHVVTFQNCGISLGNSPVLAGAIFIHVMHLDQLHPSENIRYILIGRRRCSLSKTRKENSTIAK